MNAPITSAELKEILRLHSLWLEGNAGGKRANLRSADLRSADLSWANLRSADLRSADLSWANLRSADLRSADLRSADLSWADLRSADLSWANLRSADLRSADLSWANLRSADLSWANLRSADLSWADLRSADLRSADLILVGQDIRGYLFYACLNDDNVITVRAGCRQFVGIQAAKLHWMNRHTENKVLHEDCMSLIARCEHMAIVRGWQLEPEIKIETEKEIA